MKSSGDKLGSAFPSFYDVPLMNKIGGLVTRVEEVVAKVCVHVACPWKEDTATQTDTSQFNIFWEERTRRLDNGEVVVQVRLPSGCQVHIAVLRKGRGRAVLS